jgi:uncharacterized protein YkwD
MLTFTNKLFNNTHFSDKPIVIPPFGMVDISTMYMRINEIRIKKGLPSLQVDANLQYIAEQYAIQMLKSNKFSHIDSMGNGPLERFKKNLPQAQVWCIAENIAIAPSTADAQKSLENSRGHYKNMIATQVSLIGAGAISNGLDKVYFCQLFGNYTLPKHQANTNK